MKSRSRPIETALGLLLWCSLAQPKTLYVREGSVGTPPYDTPETAAGTIQQAVDAAEYRDVVRVGPGLYVEQVILHDGVVLWGAGPDVTVVQRPEDARQLEIGEPAPAVVGAADTEIRGLNILSPEYYEFQFWRGTGVYLGPWPGQLLSDCRITGPFLYGVKCDGPAGQAPIVIRRCTVDQAWRGITVAGEWTSCVIQDCLLRGNNAGIGLSAEHLNFGAITVTRTVVSGYSSGIYVIGGWQVSVENCAVQDNIAHGVYAEDLAHVDLWSTVVCGSRLGVGYDEGTTGDVVNCTLVDNNHGLYQGAGFHVRAANTIVWGGEQPVYPPRPDSVLTLTFCDVQGGYPGEGNIDADPMFVDPSARDFRLRPQSLCIDAGSSSDPYRPAWWWGVDGAGNPRKLYGGKAFEVDMGAYEFYINKLDPVPGTNEALFTWSSLADKTYSIFYTDDLFNWHTAIANFPSSGNQTTSWTDDGSLTGVPPLLAPKRFYRLLENP